MTSDPENAHLITATGLESEPFALNEEVAKVPGPQLSWSRALVEVILCSGYATQLAIVASLSLLRVPVTADDGSLSVQFIFLVSFIDSAVLLTLVVTFLRLSGERARDVFIGQAKWRNELLIGVATLPIVLGMVAVVQIGIHSLAPFLRNVPHNPFQSLLGSPLLVAAFVGLVVVAGGVREELQRAFLLHRFEQRLGGPRVGLLVTSVAFGLGHTIQGWDAALVTALLGATWGYTYLRRRSVIATVTSHALFNTAQVVGAYLIR